MMTSFRRSRIRTLQTNNYATFEDFFDVFDEGMNELYQLSFLLTVDHAKAERCFVAGLEESVTSNRVFKEWARSWAKRAIIQNAIRELKPRPPFNNLPSSVALHSNGELPEADQHFKLEWVAGLADFDRFVFVLSVLEHYSDRDCAVLLGCSPREVSEARARGLAQLADQLLTAVAAS
jgi:hypothetical protein